MPKQKSSVQGVALLVFVNVCWGLSFIFSKTALAEGMPVMTLAFVRYLITAALMVPLCLRREGGLRLGAHWKRGFVSFILPQKRAGCKPGLTARALRAKLVSIVNRHDAGCITGEGL